MAPSFLRLEGVATWQVEHWSLEARQGGRARESDRYDQLVIPVSSSRSATERATLHEARHCNGRGWPHLRLLHSHFPPARLYACSLTDWLNANFASPPCPFSLGALRYYPTLYALLGSGLAGGMPGVRSRARTLDLEEQLGEDQRGVQHHASEQPSQLASGGAAAVTDDVRETFGVRLDRAVESDQPLPESLAADPEADSPASKRQDVRSEDAPVRR